MVYCNLKQKKNASAIYYFGASLNDMSGEVEFFSENKNPSIIKQPETKLVASSLITKLFIKYKTDFSKGIYPKKISYEC